MLQKAPRGVKKATIHRKHKCVGNMLFPLSGEGGMLPADVCGGVIGVSSA